MYSTKYDKNVRHFWTVPVVSLGNGGIKNEK